MRLNNLQGLRGIACLLVFIFHIAQLEAHATPDARPIFTPLLSFGFAGVDLFFVLSGFVITWVNFGAIGDRGRLPGYLGRRLWRIYPIYWICWWSAVALFDTPWRTLDTRQLIRYWLLVPTVQINAILPQAWTLCFEVGFYLSFAVFLLLPRRAFLPLLGTWSAAVVAAACIPALTVLPGSQVLNWLLHPRVMEFLFGCFAALAVRRGWTGRGRTLLTAGIVGFAGGGLAFFLNPVASNPEACRVLLFGVPSALIVYGAVAVERVRGWTLPRWLLTVGDASYSIYLAHLPAFSWTCLRMGNWNPGVGPHLIWLSVLAAAGLMAGFVIHLAAERPLMALARRRPTARPGGEIVSRRQAA
jgi:exopolysaccharide production protein ExoZ